jgi:hypothetical protein
MDREELEKQASELGIKVDGRWNDARLQQEIDAKLGGTPQEETMPVLLLNDTWLEEDVRTPAGQVVDMPLSMAKKLIKGGKVARADPLPGDA